MRWWRQCEIAVCVSRATTYFTCTSGDGAFFERRVRGVRPGRRPTFLYCLSFFRGHFLLRLLSLSKRRLELDKGEGISYHNCYLGKCYLALITLIEE